MRYAAVFLALCLSPLFATAAEAPNSPAPQVQRYSYGDNLDVARVISITGNNLATACGPVKAHMVYEDSQGVTHELEYTRWGNGCQNG